MSEYQLISESLPQEGVPAGEPYHFRWTSHTVYPGVPSSIYLYLPHGAEKAESINLMICLEYTAEKVRATTGRPLPFDVPVRHRRAHPRARRRRVSRDASMNLPRTG
ncbi:hypothetical protein J7I84_01695 [Arthrobacter sp. ISL-85]|uniref:hypothetical protein n=1 Tax=Arthrobacter sp. ISL-85 TaxID=2819115 RepID=UPI001BE59CB4|nr:hypothetical protein [Arthrobacter sp. ISL-85]MBT2565220.1 hypothetical protein [Arthrobacter sp. ISL-85]